jgi:MoCo/4Fe-4S cofactor protein with predicted Tat translocation signal
MNRDDLIETTENTETTEAKRLWRSIDELENSIEYQHALHREFPVLASFSEGIDRRDFLKVMGASLGLAGATVTLGACTRMPMRKIVPYVNQPENLIPGNPIFYASTFVHRGLGTGILVETHENRPTKIEGNPDHPASLGSTDPWMQASVLSLYDPDRSKVVKHREDPSTWDEFFSVVRALPTSGKGFRILMESTTSPSEIGVIEKLKHRYPELKISSFEAISNKNVRLADREAFGEDLSRIYRFDRAKVVVSLGEDFLSRSDARVRYARDFADQRRVRKGSPQRNLLYVAETYPSLAGAMAEERLRIRPSEFEALSGQILKGTHSGPHTAWLETVVEKLKVHAGESLILCAEELPVELHRTVLEINSRLGNIGKTLEFIPSVYPKTDLVTEDLASLVSEMNSGQIQTLLILGGDPSYSAPADLEFREALKKVGVKAHLSAHFNDTSAGCDWHLPLSHSLESWGDTRTFDGTASLIQPVIAPLYESKSVLEVLAAIDRDFSTPAHDLVSEYWKNMNWDHALNRGVIEGTQFKLKSGLKLKSFEPQKSESKGGDLELQFLPDSMTWDGKYADNPWLQEIPRPMTQICWDNIVALSPKTAAALHLKNNDVVELSRKMGDSEHKIQGPVYVVPGHADQSVTVHLGWGRTRGSAVSEGSGFDAYPLRTSSNLFRVDTIQLKKLDRQHTVAAVQTHFNMEGREIVRLESIEFSQTGKSRVPGAGGAEFEPTLLPEYLPIEVAAKTEAWAMSIDLNTCIGCKTCMLACQAENNIPVVGKQQVIRTREMHWIRVDHYFEGSLDDPKMYFQPVPCMQCERAPCELVCPTEATNHSDDGLNQMVYNRCVGTRYCSNNCPYKVRRFNFLAYTKSIRPSEKLQANPDVTIRSRGVMEKCTYCVQRIQSVRIEAEKEDRPIRDGEIKTACEAACPTQAIVFGNKSDLQSRIAKLREEPLAYSLLSELGTRPRTTYLARVIT